MAQHLYKFIIVFVVIIIFSISFTSVNSVQTVDDLAYVVALGVDIGSSDNLKVTFQFTKPIASTEGSSSEPSPSVIDTVEASSVDSAITLMNTFMSKEVNFTHCKFIVFSEELARQGIEKEIYTFINNVQVRPDTNIVVTSSTANDYINSTYPSLENLVAKFYEMLPRSSEYTGFTENLILGQFFNKMLSNTTEPIAILGNTSNSSSSSKSSSKSSEGGSSGKSSEGQSSGKSSEEGSSKQSSGSSGSGSSTQTESGIQNIGLAVFSGDKMVGKLDAHETLCNLIVTNDLKNCNITINDPEDEDKIIDLFLTLDKSPEIDVQIVNGTPYAKVKVKSNARISSISDASKDITQERIAKIENAASNYLENLILSYFYKTAKELKCDIAGIGRHALKNFKTVQEFEEYSWLKKYEESFFDVNVEVHVKSNFLLTGS